MRRVAAFLKTITLGGLFVLLPVVVVIAVAAKAVIGVRATAQAIMEKLTGQGSDAAQFPMAYAILIVVGLSFVIGLTMSSALGRRCGNWIGRTLLFRLPGYAAVRAIIGGLANLNHEGALRPALLTLREGVECFVAVVEDHGDGRLTVFIPSSPNPGSGSVQIVPKDKVCLLNVRITEVGAALQQWGVGAQKVLAKDRAHRASPGAPL
jgi:uncharacterized membrane protein